jgi:hypothetical protein
MAGNDKPQYGERRPNSRPKPSLPVRVLRVLWRRREWRLLDGHHGPNWAESSIVILTVGILAVGYGQYTVYRKQARLMTESLGQNERAVILGRGQLAVAARNAQTAEDTLGEMQNENRPWIAFSRPVSTSTLFVIEPSRIFVILTMWVKKLWEISSLLCSSPCCANVGQKRLEGFIEAFLSVGGDRCKRGHWLLYFPRPRIDPRSQS